MGPGNAESEHDQREEYDVRTRVVTRWALGGACIVMAISSEVAFRVLGFGESQVMHGVARIVAVFAFFVGLTSGLVVTKLAAKRRVQSQ